MLAGLTLDEADVQRTVVERLFQAGMDLAMVQFIKDKCTEAEQALSSEGSSSESESGDDADASADNDDSQNPYPGFHQNIPGGFGAASEEDDDDDNDNDGGVGGSTGRRQACYAVEYLPPPPPFNSRHCPPLASAVVFHATCDCLLKHNQLICCVAGDPELQMEGRCQRFLNNEMDKARRMADTGHRNPNNTQRKRCYRKVASEFDYRTRRELPACAVAKIRQIWPDQDGKYMGYRGH